MTHWCYESASSSLLHHCARLYGYIGDIDIWLIDCVTVWTLVEQPTCQNILTRRCVYSTRNLHMSPRMLMQQQKPNVHFNTFPLSADTTLSKSSAHPGHHTKTLESINYNKRSADHLQDSLLYAEKLSHRLTYKTYECKSFTHHVSRDIDRALFKS